MDIEKAKKIYVESCLANGSALDRGDSRAANRAAGSLRHALKVIRREPDHGASFFASLLNHENVNLRVCAAADLLPFDEQAAVPVLEAIAAMPPFYISGSHASFSAKIVLEQWHLGRWKGYERDDLEELFKL